MKSITLFLAAILAALSVSANADPTYPCNRSFPVTSGANTLYLRYCSNYDLSVSNGAITELHFFIHGSSRTQPGYIASMITDYTGTVARRSQSIVLMGPHFISAEENNMAVRNEYNTATGETLDLDGVNSNVLYWDGGWARGDMSATGTETGGMGARPFRVSSHDVLDRILAQAVAKYPNLKRILLWGHSSGAGMMGYYIMSANIPPSFPEENVIFAPANGGVSFYFDRLRPVAPMTVPIVWQIPDDSWCDGLLTYRSGSLDPQNFSSYDNFAYAAIDDNPADGVIDSANTWFGQFSVATLKARMLRRVWHRQHGMLDNDPYDTSFDQDCPRHVQGNNRLTRTEGYFEHIGNQFKWQKLVEGTQMMLYVPGVAHSGSGIWKSTCGRYWTLGVNANSASPNGGTCAVPYVFYDSFDGGLGSWTQSGTGTVSTSTARRVKTAYAARFLGAQSKTLTSPLISEAGPYTLSWGWRIGSRLGAGDTIVAQRSVNGGTWTEIARLTGNSDKENVWHYNGITLAASSSIQLRFIVTVTAGADKDVWLDEVRIMRRLGLPE